MEGSLGRAMDLSRVRAIEDANLNGFPSEMQAVDRAWLVRLSPGNPARRVNSLNILDQADDADMQMRLTRAQALFAAQGVPFHLRWTPLTPPTLVAHVDAAGWPRVGETDVWVRDIDPVAEGPQDPSGPVARIETVDLDAWIAAFGAIGGTRPEAVTPVALDRLRAALSRVAVPLVCLRARNASGDIAGVAVAVADGDLLGIYDLAVAPAARRFGLGSRLVTDCLAQGRRRDCRTAWLQVTRENAPARALYARLGFVPAYSYHYRHPPGDAATT